jgi:hypothetical protein
MVVVVTGVVGVTGFWGGGLLEEPVLMVFECTEVGPQPCLLEATTVK